MRQSGLTRRCLGEASEGFVAQVLAAKYPSSSSTIVPRCFLAPRSFPSPYRASTRSPTIVSLAVVCLAFVPPPIHEPPFSSSRFFSLYIPLSFVHFAICQSILVFAFLVWPQSSQRTPCITKTAT